MNYYTFQTNDYAKCTSYLSLMEDLAYRRMLDLYYVTELPLILDTDKIAKRIGMVDNIEAVEYILSEYFFKTEDGYYNRRCEKEISKYHDKVTRAKRAIKSRWNPTKEARSNIREGLDTKRNTDKIPTNNNINNKNSIKESTKEKATRLSENFKLPIEWQNWYFTERPNGNLNELASIFSTFKDHWLAKAGKDGSKVSWFATWRNWVRREKSFNPKKAEKFDAIAYVNRNNNEGNHGEPSEKDITSEVVRTD